MWCSETENYIRFAKNIQLDQRMNWLQYHFQCEGYHMYLKIRYSAEWTFLFSDESLDLSEVNTSIA